jgi:hypothetical protein
MQFINLNKWKALHHNKKTNNEELRVRAKAEGKLLLCLLNSLLFLIRKPPELSAVTRE